MRQIAIPPEVANDADSVEILRAWIDAGRISASVATTFGTAYDDPLETTWALVLSDAAHHLVDAIVIETGQQKEDVRACLSSSLRAVVASRRDTIVGSLRTVALQRELPITCGAPDSGSLELLRVFKRSEGITMVLFVGVWLKQKSEEQNWANILYDLAWMLASALEEKGTDERRDRILAELLAFIDEPTTTYSGYYAKKTQPGATDNPGDAQ